MPEVYVGDLSLQDAQVLIECSSSANSILEFGVGGSTHLMSGNKPVTARYISIDTDTGWIERTKENLAALGYEDRCNLFPYDEWKSHVRDNDKFDLIFVDGTDTLRLPFAMEAWDYLKVGGWMLFHDTRRDADIENVFALSRAKYLEISTVQINYQSSNITKVQKKMKEPYVDWNVVEKKVTWQAGYEAPPKNWVEIMRKGISPTAYEAEFLEVETMLKENQIAEAIQKLQDMKVRYPEDETIQDFILRLKALKPKSS